LISAVFGFFGDDIPEDFCCFERFSKDGTWKFSEFNEGGLRTGIGRGDRFARRTMEFTFDVTGAAGGRGDRFARRTVEFTFDITGAAGEAKFVFKTPLAAL
jgi:hypothetical protein